jgi:DNA-binding transcriptional LysR family regulator
VRLGEIDLAIVYGSDRDFHLKTEPLLLDELVLVGPPDSGMS